MFGTKSQWLAVVVFGVNGSVATFGDSAGRVDGRDAQCGAKDEAVLCTPATAAIIPVGYQRGDTNRAKQDIVEVAISAGSFTTLLAAAQAAGLVDTLKGEGPLTVFAPTDEAFARLPAGTVESLLKPENRAKLVSILTYHVVPGRLMATDVVSRSAVATVNGQRIDVEVRDGSVFLGNSRVLSADIDAKNGVIHVIDTVMLPVSSNIVELASSAGQFATLLAAAQAAGLAETLMGGEFTLLAPTDEAFAQLPAGTVENLLRPENREKLRSVLLFHVIPGRLYADQAITAARAKTVHGQSVNFAIRGGRVIVNGATLLNTDLKASNGVVHVIDRVILPE